MRLIFIFAFGLSALYLVLWTGTLPQIIFGHDLFVFLEGASKWRHGILPHADYYSPLGPMTYALIAFSADLTGTLKTAMPVAVAIMGLVVLITGTYAACTRLTWPFSIGVIFLLLGTAISPAHLRFPPESWSYAGIYNRWGYAVLGIITIVNMYSSTKSDEKSESIDGALTALGVGLLLLMKVSYGVVGIAVVIGINTLRRRTLPFYLSSAATTLAITLLVGWSLRWELGAMLADFSKAKNARSGLDIATLLETSRQMGYQLALSGIVCGAAIFCSEIRSRRDVLVNILIYFGLLFAAVLITQTNSPLGNKVENPLLVLLALLALHDIIRGLGTRTQVVAAERSFPSQSMLRLIIGIVAALTLAIPVILCNYLSLTKAALFTAKNRSLSSEETLQDGPLAGLQFRKFGGDPQLPSTYVGKLTDGLRLLEATGNLGRPVATFDFSNPFNVIQNIRPPSGTPTFWHMGFSYQKGSSPAADQVFKEVEVVLIPKIFGDGNQANLNLIEYLYGKWIDQNFTMTGESLQWRIYTANVPVHNRNQSF